MKVVSASPQLVAFAMVSGVAKSAQVSVVVTFVGSGFKFKLESKNEFANMHPGIVSHITAQPARFSTIPNVR